MLNACNRQTAQTAIIGFVMLANIIANFFLIPRFGVIGAASSALLGNFLLFALAYSFVPRITKISHGYLIKTALQVVFAAGIMGLGVWWVDKTTNFVLAIIAGAIIYTIMILLTHIVRINQLKSTL
jgi:O-antigen/teichoic acid export membrane protein